MALFLGLYQGAQESLAKSDQGMIESTQIRAQEISKTFEAIEKLTSVPCSPQHLSEMRAIVFQTYTIRDAAYTKGDKVLCSSSFGQVVGSIEAYGPPLFRGTDGRQIWRDIELPTAPGLKSSVVLKGHLSLLVSPSDLRSTTQSGNPVSTVLTNPLSGSVTTVRGPHVTLDAASIVDGARLRSGFNLIAIECINLSQPCQVQEIGLATVWREFALPIVLVILGGATLGGAAALITTFIKRRRATLENRLRRALSSDELFLKYQPIVDIRTGHLAGAEALMRWTFQSRDSVSPAEFVAAAERSSLITDLTCFAIETVSRELRGFLVASKDLVVSINIVPRDLTDPRFHKALRQHILGAGIDPRRIAFELTERQPINSVEAIESIRTLHQEGYRIFIDDFGTGYSNIAYLSELPIDTIKLDKIFTHSVGSNNVRSRLTPAILDMAADLNVPLLVEGIETLEQEAYFQMMGVEFAQGWHYSREVSAADLMTLARADRIPTTEASSIAACVDTDFESFSG